MSKAKRREKCVQAARGAGIAGLAALASSAAGCLDRPVAESHPATTDVVVTQLQNDSPKSIDLLFMIDNSQSMADKQALLASAVPALVRRLLEPRCLDPDTGAPLGGSYPCAAGIPEFPPVGDLHLGVISSSLGGHGSDMCSPAYKGWDPKQDDGAHLLGERRGLAGADGLGFLAWNPGSKPADSSTLMKSFADQVMSAGETGCGYEAQLESWYRFLIDPEPPASVSVENGTAVLGPVDEVLLQQRAEFLRPNSLVAVVMLTDENDCSIVDGGQGWYAAQTKAHMYRATSACDADPNDPCCRSCGSNESAPPTGCVAIAADPACQPMTWDDAGDDPNLRCFDQKRRFGTDFLYPTQRYVDGLTKHMVPNRSGELVPNPLFADLTQSGKAGRGPGLVFLAGILGVPWQDVATDASLSDPTALAYLSADDLGSRMRWDWLVGNDHAPPTDPLMIESTSPRSGQNPATGAALVPPDSSAPSGMNGHEWLPAGRDLEYACTYPLAAPRDCTTVASDKGCDCRNAAMADAEKNPLCQNPTTGQYGTTQYFAKAYPGTRQLRVLQGLGENAIVASICPKIAAGDSAAPSYGYNPAVDAIVDRLSRKLNTRCLPRPLALGADGSAQCAVVEAVSGSGVGCDASRNRSSVDATLDHAVRRQLRESGRCGPDSPSGEACDALTLCTIGGATDTASCQNDATPSGMGWCYVDPARGLGNPALVAGCPATDRRMVRFVGDDTPSAGASVFIACLGAPLGSSSNTAP